MISCLSTSLYSKTVSQYVVFSFPVSCDLSIWSILFEFFCQAVLKQFTGGGSQGENVITDEAELQRHQQLERLYTSTRAGKVFSGTWLVL
jgi:hypothetical protein